MLALPTIVNPGKPFPSEEKHTLDKGSGRLLLKNPREGEQSLN